MKLGEAFVEIKSDDKEFKKELTDTEKRVARATTGIQRDFNSLNMDRAAKAVRTLKDRLINLKTVAVAALTGWGVGRLATSFLEASSTAESYQTRLTVLLRSQEEGNRLFKEMADYASRVPFEYENIMASATALSGVMRGGVDEIKQWMPLIGDLAAAAGLTIEETTEQIIRMYSAGAAAADKFRDRGILAMLGFKAKTAYTAQETREIMMREWQKMDSQFRGATAALADDWRGLTSMLADAWFQVRTTIMEAGAFDSIKKALGDVLARIEELKRSGKFEEWAVSAGKKIDEWVNRAIEILKDVAEKAAKAVVLLSASFDVLIIAIKALIAYKVGALLFEVAEGAIFATVQMKDLARAVKAVGTAIVSLRAMSVGAAGGLFGIGVLAGYLGFKELFERFDQVKLFMFSLVGVAQHTWEDITYYLKLAMVGWKLIFALFVDYVIDLFNKIPSGLEKLYGMLPEYVRENLGSLGLPEELDIQIKFEGVENTLDQIEKIKEAHIEAGKAIDEGVVAAMSAVVMKQKDIKEESADWAKGIRAEVIPALKIVSGDIADIDEGLREILDEAMKGVGKLSTDFRGMVDSLVEAGKRADVAKMIPFAREEIVVQLEDLNEQLEISQRLFNVAQKLMDPAPARKLALVMADLKRRINELNKEMSELDEMPLVANINAMRDSFEAAFKDINSRLKKGSVEYQQEVMKLIRAVEIYLKALPALTSEQAEEAIEAIKKLLFLNPPEVDKNLKDIENIYKVFLEQTQIMFADIFEDIFEGVFEGWSGLLDRMSDMLTGFGSQALSKATMEFGSTFAEQFKKGLGAGESFTAAIEAAGPSAMIGTGVGMVGMAMRGYLGGDNAAERERERRNQAAILKILKEVNEELDDLLANYNTIKQAIHNVNEKYENYRDSLLELGADIEQLTELEKTRAQVVAETMRQLEEEFNKKIQIEIDRLTMTGFKFDLSGLQRTYEEQAEEARALSRESVQLLDQLFQLQLKQYGLQVETLLGEKTSLYQEIIDELSLSSIENQLNILDTWYHDEVEALGEIGDKIEALQDQIGEQEQLRDTLVAINDTLERNIPAIENLASQVTTPYDVQYAELYGKEWQETLLAAFYSRYESLDAQARQEWLQYLKNQGFTQQFEDILMAYKALRDELEAVGITGVDINWGDIPAAGQGVLQTEFYGGMSPEDFGIPALETLPIQIADLNTMIDDLINGPGGLNDLLTQSSEAPGLALAAFEAQMAALEKETAESVEAIIRQHTLTQQELKQFNLDEWLEEQLTAYEALGLATDRLLYAYELQKEAIWETTDAADGLTNALDRTLQSIDDMIAELTGGRYAAVQSMEFYQQRYQQLLAAGDVERFLSYIPEYLEFMKTYGADYAAVTAQVVADLRNLRAEVAATGGAQHGGLISRLSYVAEKGPEWVIPTYEPERSRLLADLGIDTHLDQMYQAIRKYIEYAMAWSSEIWTNVGKYVERFEPSIGLPTAPVKMEVDAGGIGKAITDTLLPIITMDREGNEVHIHINIDGQPIRNVVKEGLRGLDGELIDIVEQHVRRISQ